MSVCHVTACYSRLDTDMLLTHRRLGPKSDHVNTVRNIHSAQRTLAHCVVSNSYMVAEPVFLELGH